MRKAFPFILALSFLFCAAPAARAAISSNTADIVLGQGNFTQNVKNCIDESGFNGATTPTGPNSIAIDTTTGRVYVADTINHRILFWNNKNSLQNGQAADGVLGQSDTYSNAINRGGGTSSCASNSLYNPRYITVDAGHNLWVSDSGNNRVLKFQNPVLNDDDADLVLGQVNMSTKTANAGGISAYTLYAPYGLKMDTNGTLWVADCSNNRVLGYNSYTSNGSSASFVLGKDNFTTGTALAVSAVALKTPIGIAIDSANNVWVADTGYNRVMRFCAYASTPTGSSADMVLGQRSFNTSTTGITASALNAPYGIYVVGVDTVCIADRTNNRVLEYSLTISTISAQIVLGQQSFTVNLKNDSDGNGATDSVQADTLFNPWDVAVDENNAVWVVDLGNSRVLKYASPAIGADASLVLGQGDFIHNAVNFADGYGFNTASGVAYDPKYGRVFVADNLNQRVLWWDSYEYLANHTLASGVLGQELLISTAPNRGGVYAPAVRNGLFLDGPSSSNLDICGVAVDGLGNVWVADPVNNRVLMYHGDSLASGMDADLVVGQGDFLQNYANRNTGVADNTLNHPNGIVIDAANNLWVADRGNNRVLRFDPPLYSTASIELGQADFVTASANRGSLVGINTLSSPYDVRVDVSSNVWVADYANNRVLKYSYPVSNGMDATLVLGQIVFSGGSANQGGSASENTLSGPKGVCVDAGGNVWVADTINNRVLRYDTPVSTGGTYATYVFGQADFSSTGNNRGGSANNNTLYRPIGLALDAKNSIWIADSSNSRVLKVNSFFVTSITPNKGGNTTSVSITNLAGGDLQSTYDVRLLKTGQTDIVATGVSASGSRQITCTFDLAGQATGYWDVKVSTGVGGISATLPAAFEIVPMTVSSITPASGGNKGTVSITNLAGYGFLAGNQVKLKKSGQADIAATNVTVVDAGRITCDFNLNGAETGTWDIEVSSNSYLATLAGGFTVNGLTILVSTITPSFGYESGPVNITKLGGGGFADGCQAKLVKTGQADIPAGNLALVDASSMTCTFNLMGAATGFWNVVVSTGGVGSSSSTLAGGFEVRPMQVLAALPAAAANSGVAFSSITGQGFVPGSQVKLTKIGQADIPGTDAAVYASSITCTFDIMGKATGYWDIAVSTGGAGSLTRVLANGFEVFPMQVTSLVPSSGVNTINVAVSTISGQGFVPGSQVKLVRPGAPDIAGTGVTVVSSSTINCAFDIIGKTTGYWDVVVSTGGAGSFSCALSSGFALLPMQVTSVTEEYGYNTSTETITDLAGQGFLPGSQVKLVKFGQPEIIATNVTVVSSTSITCAFNLNGAEAGFWNIIVSTGTLSCTLVPGLNVLPLGVSSITPNKGLCTGSVNITNLWGRAFIPSCEVWLERAGEDRINGTSVVVANAGHTITCSFDLLNKATGYWDVVVSTGGPGAMSHKLYDGFNIVSVIVTTVTPNSGFNSGPVNMTDIGGEGFTSTSEVILARPGQTDIAGTNVTVNSSSSIACSFDLTGQTTGYWDLVISTGGVGSYAFTLSSGFAVLPMRVTAVAPADPANTAIMISTLTGQGFVPGSQVKLARTGESDVPGADVTVHASSITCSFDLTGRTTGYWDVVVSTGGAGSFSCTLSSGLIVMPMQVTAASPASAVNTKSISFSTITGRGFVPGSQVKLVQAGQSDIAGTGVTVVGMGTIICTFDIAAKATGYWDIVVSTGGPGSMSATLAGGLEVLPMQITSIAPVSGYNSGIVSIGGIVVQGLVPGSQAKLVKSGQADITGMNIAVYASSITCKFDLTNKTTGPWDIVVSTGAAGSMSCTLANGYNVLPMQVTSLEKNIAANTNILISFDVNGLGFVAGSKGKLQKAGQPDINALNCQYFNSIKVRCGFNLWGAATGYWDLVVTTDTVTAVFPAAFAIEPMLVSSTTPNGAVNSNSAATINIHGQGFVPGSSVSLTRDGSIPIEATNVTVTNGSGIATTASGTFDLLEVTTGYWNVVVTTDAISCTLPNAFFVNSFLVSSITPNCGYNTGLATCTVSGVNFPATSQVKLKKAGNAPVSATGVTVASPGTIFCTFDLTSQTTGLWDVEVSTGVGSVATTTLADGFTILPMQISSVSPNTAYNYGTATVTVHGDGFLSGTRVKLFKTDEQDITASNIAVVNANTIVCLFNLTRKPTGYWDVMVTTGSAVNLLSGGFEIIFSTLNLTSIDPGQDTTVTVATESGDVTIAMPVGTFGEEVRVLLTQAEAPETKQPTLKVTQVCYEITNDKGLQPQKEFILTIHYLDGDVAGMDESRLVISRYDPANARWIPLPSTVNADENYVQANVNHLSRFAVTALVPATDVSSVRAFPSPYSPLRHPLGLIIDNLPADADIKLYTVTGELVSTVPYTDQSGRTAWFGKNDSGVLVANGVYIALIKSPDGIKRIKIAVEK